jgi:putative membrane protein
MILSGVVVVWKGLPIAQRRMIASLLVAVTVANIAQPYPDLAPLQHGPTVALALAAPWLLRRWPMSNRSVLCVWLFLLLHTLGARWIYSYVPYDDWVRALTGLHIGAARNSYDRFVHFACGALLTLPIVEMTRRERGGGLFVALAMIGLASTVYEIFEWALTIVAAGETADYYNGQQGDVWDAQKDMALALTGSLVAITVMLARPPRHPH